MLGRWLKTLCVRRRLLPSLALLPIVILLASCVYGQTASTGALTGITLDPSGAVLPGVSIDLVNEETTETQSTTSDEEGRFWFVLLSPGAYELRANKTNFDVLRLANISVSVTETLRLELRFRLTQAVARVQVFSEPTMVQNDSSAFGRLVNEQAVSNLPLVTRNFAQTTSLAPGVVAGVYNATELGAGGTALSQISKSNDGIYVQLEGISVTDVQGSGASSGGFKPPVNPRVGQLALRLSF